MSVLYKALARAAKARASASDSSGSAPAATTSRGRGGGGRRPLILLLVLVVVLGGGYSFFGDDIVDAANLIIFGPPEAPPMTAKRPAMAKAQPGVPAKPDVVQVAATAGGNASSAPAAVAAPAPIQPPATSATPTSPAASATPTPPATGLQPTLAPAPSSPSPPAAPAAGPTATPPASATGPAVTPPAPAVAPGPTVTQPASAAVTPVAPAPAAKTAAISAEQNLPELLDRIRQQHAKPAPSTITTVDRSTPTTETSNQAQSMVTVTPTTPTTPNERDATEHAYDMLLHGQYEGALELYDSVVKTSPDSLPALLGRAIALHKLRRLSEARASYQKVLSIDSNNREALTNITAIVAAQQPAAALTELRDLEKTHPGFSPIAAQIAEIEARQGNVADAIASFNRAIQLSPDNGLYWLNLAILEDRAGMAEEAVAAYTSALDKLAKSGAQLPIPIDSIRARLRYLQTR